MYFSQEVNRLYLAPILDQFLIALICRNYFVSFSFVNQEQSSATLEGLAFVMKTDCEVFIISCNLHLLAFVDL